MVASLPGNIRLKLQQTLAQWRQWQCDTPLPAAPEVEAVLAHGLSNFSVLVASDRRFVVRIDGVNPAVHRLNRQREWHHLDAANRAGLAPAPRYFNPELGSLVCDYLEPDKAQPLALTDLARLLRGIHALPAGHHRLDLAERLRSYEQHLAHSDPRREALLAPYRPAVAAALASCHDPGQPSVLCHHDLLRANRLYSDGRLFALDWEYCAMGSAWYDLAVVIAGDELGADATDTLLQAYLGRRPEAAEARLVRRYACVYRYLELLWYAVQRPARCGDQQLEDKLERLGKQLRQD